MLRRNITVLEKRLTEKEDHLDYALKILDRWGIEKVDEQQRLEAFTILKGINAPLLFIKVLLDMDDADISRLQTEMEQKNAR